MLMDAAVLCLAFSRDDDTLASGDQSGCIKVWRVSTGVCVRRFQHAHPLGVTSITFNKDATQILSSSFEGSIRVHGLNSGKMLKEFRGHTSFVNDAVFSPDNSLIMSGSSDGSVRVRHLVRFVGTFLIFQNPFFVDMGYQVHQVYT